jgi:hypothetical protein
VSMFKVGWDSKRRPPQPWEWLVAKILPKENGLASAVCTCHRHCSLWL